LFQQCKKNPHKQVDKKQKIIVFGSDSESDRNKVSMKLVDFNQEQTLIALAKMIIIEELAFKFVENERFRKFMEDAQPKFKIPSRVTIVRYCMHVFNDEKEKLKRVSSANKQMVLLTMDIWTSIQNMNYMCMTTHYIDEGWELNKKILTFCLISFHKGETIGVTLENCLKEWGISKVCCVIVDNASANNLAISYLAKALSVLNGHTLLNGECMHMRCSDHILNLIISDGLKEIDLFIRKIRVICKFVKSSPSRFVSFKRCVEEVSVSTKVILILDVPTR